MSLKPPTNCGDFILSATKDVGEMVRTKTRTDRSIAVIGKRERETGKRERETGKRERLVIERDRW